LLSNEGLAGDFALANGQLNLLRGEIGRELLGGVTGRDRTEMLVAAVHESGSLTHCGTTAAAFTPHGFPLDVILRLAGQLPAKQSKDVSQGKLTSSRGPGQ
jgi:hypothetical protein